MIAVSQTSSQITLEEFLKLPETKPYSEYINGKTEQKPMPQGEHSTLQARLVALINQITIVTNFVEKYPLKLYKV